MKQLLWILFMKTPFSNIIDIMNNNYTLLLYIMCDYYSYL